MVPRRVRLKGFLSYRDEVTFRFDDASLWMLSGSNGAGKSSVFDAITFALYGLHRNGRQGLKELINAQSDSLEVEFDFGTGGRNYRVVRTVSRNEASTFYAASLDDATDIQEGEEKEADGDYADDTDKKDGLKAWVERIVGLDESTFTASVLLRQGEGDKILTAKPRERFEMLSRIVNLSHYKRLHETAVRHLNEQNGVVQTWQKELNKHAPYDTAEIERIELEIARIGTAIETAAGEIDALKKRKEKLAGLLISAQRYEELNTQIADHRKVINEMENLLANAAEVRRKAARLVELTGVTTILERIVALRRQVKNSADALQSHQDDANQWIKQLAGGLGLDSAVCSPASLLSALDTEINRLMEMKPVPGRLCEYIQARDGWNCAWAALKEILAQIQALDAVLVQLLPRLEDARLALAQAQQKEDEAREMLQEATLVSRYANDALKRFEMVAGAQNCSYCGLPLTPEHRDKERQDLSEKRREAARAQGRAQADYDAAAAIRDTAQRNADRWTGQQTQQEKERARLLAKQATLENSISAEIRAAQAALNALPPPVATRIGYDPRQEWHTRFANPYPDDADIAALQIQVDKLPDLQNNRTSIQTLVVQIQNENFRLESFQMQLRYKMAELPDAWRTTGETFDDAQLKGWKTEVEALQAENVADALLQLHQADTATADHKEKLHKAQEEMDTIPVEARVPTTGLQLQDAELDVKLDQADKAKTKDMQDKVALEVRLEAVQRLTEQLASAKRLANHYATLGRHLGPTGLQLHLLRQAEASIVANADEILHSISNGMLRLELRAGGVNKALDVVAHNSETGSKPIPVGFLSGSQKFRVAVSLALGIGQYASQGNQSIQSVIIDEGFGSLDKQARGDMIHALQSLTNRLERVIVVSHQDDVTEAFRDRYHICLENGTSIATPIHLA